MSDAASEIMRLFGKDAAAAWALGKARDMADKDPVEQTKAILDFEELSGQTYMPW